MEWKIDDGDIDDLKDLKSDKNTTYSAKDAWVMKTVDDETARLVYIFWTETEKGDTRDITFTGSDFTVKSESATTSVDGKVATVNDKGMDAKFSISAADGYDLVSVKLEDGTVLTAKDGVYTIKNVTKDMKVEVTTKAIVKAKGTVTLGNNILVTYTEGNRPTVPEAIAAIQAEMEKLYSDVTVTSTGLNTYRFTGVDQYGITVEMDWNASTHFYQTYLMNGVPTKAGTVIPVNGTTYTEINGKLFDTAQTLTEDSDVVYDVVKIVDADGNELARGTQGASDVTVTVAKGENKGTGFVFGGALYAYDEETSLSSASTKDVTVAPGYVKLTVGSSEGYREAEKDITVTTGAGTGFVYSVGDGEDKYAKYSDGIDGSEVTGDIVIAKGYIAVSYDSDSTVTGPAYTKATDTEITVTYTVSGLQAGDPVTVNFGGTNVTSSQQDSFTAVATEMTRNFDLQIDAAGTDVVDITATI